MTVSISRPDARSTRTTVVIGTVTLHYSYDSVIAFETPGTGLVVSENAWGNTTGRHINRVIANAGFDGEKTPRPEFVERLTKTLNTYGL